MFARVFYYVLIIAVAHIRHGTAYNYLGLFPYGGKSHFDVFKPFLIELANRGHNVTVLSFFPLEDPPGNYRDISLVGMDAIHVEIVDMKNFETCPSIFHGLARSFQMFVPLDARALEVCEKIFKWPGVIKLMNENVKYDAVFIEGFNSDCLLGLAHDYGAPVITMSSCQMITWTPDRFGVHDASAFLPLNGVSFADGDLSIWERFQNVFFTNYWKWWFRYRIQVKEEAILKRVLGKTYDLEALAKKSNLLLVNAHHSLSGVRPLPPGVVEVGGMHLNRTKNELPAEIEKFLKGSEDNVIVFSLGSMMKSSTMSKHIQEIFIKVFSKFPIRVIWKWDVGTIDGIGDNVLVAKWIPQYDLLRHPKVIGMIGHGGLLGLTEVVDAGKPIVGIPFYGDQPTNMAMAQERGIGVLLEYCQITEETLTEALAKMLSPSMRDKAKKLSAVWHDRPMEPLDEAIYWTERVTRFGDEANLIPHLRDIPFYKTAMLDLIGIVILFIVVVYFIFRKIIRLALRFIGISQSKLKTN